MVKIRHTTWPKRTDVSDKGTYHKRNKTWKDKFNCSVRNWKNNKNSLKPSEIENVREQQLRNATKNSIN